MSLQTRISDFAVAVATDVKQIRGWLFGASGDLTSLTTTDKSSFVAAINEVKASATGAPPAATETNAGVVELATTAEVTTGTDDIRFVSPLKLQQKLTAWAQPLSANLTALAGVASGAFGRTLLGAADQASARTSLGIASASETVEGLAERATTAEVTAGTDDVRFVTPAKLAAKLTAWAQPLSANLTTLAGVASGTFGRTLLGASTAASARTSLGLATVASTGSAADLTGVLPTSALPSLAINEFYSVATQSAMLALTAQPGDVAIRTDQNGKMYILADNDPTLLANWKLFTGAGDVTSVAGKTGAVTLVKADVGLSNVDNTSDANKPVSTATSTALATKVDKASNLSDLANVTTARANLSVYSKAELGDPETDLVAVYTAAKV